MKTLARAGLILALPACLGGILAGPASRALAGVTITVSSCDEPSLDAAVAQANTDDAGDTITFGCSGTIDLTGTLTITGSMTMDGSGQQIALDGQRQVGVLTVASGVAFTMNDLTVQNGSGGAAGLDNEGGTVTITDSTFSDDSGVGAGAVYNSDGTVSISGSTFTDNYTFGAHGGALNNRLGTVSITGSDFEHNFSMPPGGSGTVYGGAVANVGGNLTIRSTIFASDNNASYGGAIYTSDGVTPAGTPSTGTLDVTDSSFTGNRAANGGAIDVAAGTATITFSTFDVNDADASGAAGGNLQVDSGTASVGESIFLGSPGTNCGGNPPTDQGYDLESGTDCGFTGTGDVQNATQAGLGVDIVPQGLCPATDLYGNPRPDHPSEAACDSGAGESAEIALSASADPSGFGQPVTFTATITHSDGGLVEFFADGSALPDCGAQPLSQVSGGAYSATCTTSALPAGTHAIAAAWLGASSYPAGAFGSLAGGQTVNQVPQSISFAPPATGVAGGSATLTASGGGSGNPVVFSVDPSSGPGVCSTSGQNGATVNYTAAGSCVIDANQAGAADYAPAPQVSQTVTVDQAPAFVVASPPLTATAGQQYDYAFTASGTPAPSYALVTGAPSWLTMNPSTGEVAGAPPAGTTSFSYAVTAINRAGSATTGPFTVTVAAPSPAADLSVRLACPATTTVGGLATCTLTVTNVGPATASKIAAASALPASLAEVSCTAGCTRYANVLVWTFASLPRDHSATVTVTVKASRTGSAWVLAAAACQGPDPHPLNNIAAAEMTVQTATPGAWR